MDEGKMNNLSRKTIQDLTISKILLERKNQDEKWGKDRIIDINGNLANILGEEYGEVCRAILNKDDENLQEELIQLGALCVATVEQMLREEYTKKVED